MPTSQTQFATIAPIQPTGARRLVTLPDAGSTRGEDSDAVLFRRFRNDGDVDAFERLFRRHRDALVAYLWTLAGNESIAEDISQHCWLRLMEGDEHSGYQPRPGVTISAYLRTLGRNRFIDEYKRKHGEARTDSVDDIELRVSTTGTALDEAAQIEVRCSIEVALADLPWKQRDVISMWLLGFSIEEMMHSTSSPRDTVLSRKKYGMKKLKAAFETAGVWLHDAKL